MKTARKRAHSKVEEGLREALAERDKQFAHQQKVIRAMGETANASEALMELRQFGTARAMLGLIRGMYIDSLRDQVAREPGGVNHKEARDA